MFTIESERLSLEEKRSLLDWIISPKIRSVSGVAEVNALGGKVRTYEVVPNLNKMRTMGITLEQIFQTLEKNNQNDGAGRVSQGVESILVRSVGQLKSISDIQTLPVGKSASKVITLADVATVKYGYLTRAGFVSKNGQGEAVQGLVLGLKGTNTGIVLEQVKEELKKLEPMLPGDTKIDIFYDFFKAFNMMS